ncbi:hypothetical protein [Streptomyces sp. E1N211]|uniref:hypothetical protein n=1 Tax=Streptomyces sp. E1N211 TaxID=1851876 RepID=UPI0012D9DDF2|nr:hypothetical protein [Streptomyces sp. E1N211]
MSNLGFPYKKVEKESPLKSANGRRYGLTDAELAAQHGYHLPVAKQTPVLYPQTAQRLLKGEVTTFKGKKVPNGGCLGLAQQKLGEVNLQESLEVAQRLNFESYETTRGNSTVSEVNSRWSDCMKEEGHDYSDPLSAINDDQFKTPKANGHEQDVALADVRCKKKTGVIEVWSSVEGEYQQSLIRQNVGALQKGGSAKRETLRVAMQVLS